MEINTVSTEGPSASSSTHGPCVLPTQGNLCCDPSPGYQEALLEERL